MKKAIFILLFLFPISVFANCYSEGATAIYVNGIFTSKDDASKDTFLLNKEFEKRSNFKNVKFFNGYNPSHFAGGGDLMESITQAFGKPISDYDLNTILMQIHSEVTTRKILLVGHSQGTFYTNELYRYLIQHGISEKSIAVYNIATPASEVAGGGRYLTSANDSVINVSRELAAAAGVRQPLSANILIPVFPSEANDMWKGHLFSEDYLAGAAARIVSDISTELGSLAAENTSETGGGCFTPPAETAAYRMQQMGFIAGDSIAFAILDTGSIIKESAAYVASAAVHGLATVSSAAGALFSDSANQTAVSTSSVSDQQAVSQEKQDALFAVAAKLYGSSVTPEDLKNDPPPAAAPRENSQPKAFQSETFATDSSLAPFSPVLPSFSLIAIPAGSAGAGGEMPKPSPRSVVTIAETVADEIASSTEETATSTPSADTDAPNLAFNISECARRLSSAGCLIATTTITITASSSASDFARFEIACITAVGADCVGFPQTVATSSLAISAALDDRGVYTVTVRAFDETGNAASDAQTIEISTHPVVINEVAWMGTETSSSDEWLEFYNTTGSPVALDRWTLRTADGVPYISLAGIIPAHGYYLVERSDDDTVSDIAADVIVPFSGIGTGSGFNNNGERMTLDYFDGFATTTMDAVAVTAVNYWCAGDAASKRTMERYEIYASGDSCSNWGSNNAFIRNGKDAGNHSLYGTPKAKNSVSYQIANGPTLSADKTLTKENSPYMIGRDGLTVNAGATLSLEPGVVVKFVSPNQPMLRVNGSLRAGGSAAEPVVFTAFADDTYGGDMNNDGFCNPADASSTAACPGPGAWKQIYISPTSANSSLSNAVVRYGGLWFTNMSYRAAVVVDGATVPLENVAIEYSYKHGLLLTNGASVDIANSVFNHNKSYPDASGVYVNGGSGSIRQSAFSDNSNGTYIVGGTVLIEGGSVANSAYAGISVTGATTTISNVSFSGNHFDISADGRYSISCSGDSCASLVTRPNPL